VRAASTTTPEVRPTATRFELNLVASDGEAAMTRPAGA
jgi:hypothetical protein